MQTNNSVTTFETTSNWKCYKILIFLDILVSFKAWFTWGITPFYWSLCSTIIAFLFFLGNNYWFSKKIPVWWYLLLLLALITGAINSSVFPLSTVIPVLPLFFILLLKSERKEDLLNSLIKWLAVLLGISLAGWILYLIEVPLPFFPVGYGIGVDGSDNYSFMNYGFFLKNVSAHIDDTAFPRFSSVFLEPGYLGALISMLLYIGRYKINWRNAVLLLALFFSFSLAGYVIFSISLSLFVLRHPMKGSRYIIGGFVLIGGLYLYGLNANSGNNLINDKILSRLEYDSRKGNIRGYNRSAEATDDYFWNVFAKSGSLLFGGQKGFTVYGTDVDWKSYIISHGLISFLFFTAFVFTPYFQSRRDRYEIGLLSILYFIIFVNTIFLIMSMMYLVFFALGINRIKYMKGIDRVKQKSKGKIL